MRRLVIRPGAIGDFILSLPALEALSAGCTHFEVWAQSKNLSLVRFAHRTRSIAGSGLDLIELPSVSPPSGLLDYLRSFDSIISWYGANRVEFRDAVAKFGLKVEFLQALPPKEIKLHAADFYLDQVKGLVPASHFLPATPRIPVPELPRANLIAIHPFSGSPTKNWPLPRFLELKSKLEAIGWEVHFCAEPGSNLQSAVTFDDLYDLACWLAQAQLYIGNDSGITHLAAAVGTPVIALFGPTDPVVWGPRGPSVQILKASDGKMVSIQVEEVFQAALQVLCELNS